MIDATGAYNSYRNAVRLHMAQMIKLQRKENIIIYDIGNDEKYDPTLVSQRVYQTRIHADVVTLCCELNNISDPLPVGKRIALPLATTLAILRNDWGIVN